MTSPPRFAEILSHGAVVGHWVVIRWIRSGGSASVYEVRDTRFPHRRAALKLRRRDGNAPPAEFAAETALLRNRRLGAYAPLHLDEGTHDGEPYVVMELARPLPKNRTVRQALVLAPGMADAVKALFALHLLHRDLKHANFGLIDSRVVLLDLETVFDLRADLADGQVVGSPGSMAPEVRTEAAYTSQTEIYAFAAAFAAICSDVARDYFAPVINEGLAGNFAERTQTLDAFLVRLLDMRESSVRRIARLVGMRKLRLGLRTSIILAFLAAATVGAAVVVGYKGLSAAAKFFYDVTTREDRLDTVATQPDTSPQLAQTSCYQAISDPEQAYGTALTYYSGKARNAKLAVFYLEKAVQIPDKKKRGEVYGLLAECLYRGKRWGCERNFKKARKYAERGKELGDKRAILILSLLDEKQLGF